MIPVRNIYWMLAYAFRALEKGAYERLGSEEFGNAQELCAATLARGVESQIKRGLGRGYSCASWCAMDCLWPKKALLKRLASSTTKPPEKFVFFSNVFGCVSRQQYRRPRSKLSIVIIGKFNPAVAFGSCVRRHIRRIGNCFIVLAGLLYSFQCLCTCGQHNHKGRSLSVLSTYCHYMPIQLHACPPPCTRRAS